MHGAKCRETQPCCKCAQSREESVAVRDCLMKHVPLNNICHRCPGHGALGLCLGASQPGKCLALAPSVSPQRRQLWGWVPCALQGTSSLLGIVGTLHGCPGSPTHPCFPLPSPSSVVCRGWTAGTCALHVCIETACLCFTTLTLQSRNLPSQFTVRHSPHSIAN